jgi:hypothetical protein
MLEQKYTEEVIRFADKLVELDICELLQENTSIVGGSKVVFGIPDIDLTEDLEHFYATINKWEEEVVSIESSLSTDISGEDFVVWGHFAVTVKKPL